MTRQLPISLLGFVAFLVLLLCWVRVEHEQLKELGGYAHAWTHDQSPVMEKALAGPVAGLMSDMRILDVFSIYYDASASKQAKHMSYLSTYLMRAQNLDPKFIDPYRLAGSILAYDANNPKDAIALLQMGANERPDIWEFPFIAGFIAHDMLKDDALAFDLMSQVVAREGTPLLVVTLASRFLAASSTKEDAILFLRGMKQLMPEDYQEGINRRIQQYQNDLTSGN